MFICISPCVLVSLHHMYDHEISDTNVFLEYKFTLIIVSIHCFYDIIHLVSIL